MADLDMTSKQAAFVTDLAKRKPLAMAKWKNSQVSRGLSTDPAGLSKKSASTLITWLMAQPSEAVEKTEKTEKPSEPELEDGMYLHPVGGYVVRVYHTVHGANVQVAKRLVVKREGRDAAGKSTYSHEFVYEGKAGLKGLRPEDRMDAATAKRLGIEYSFCVRCGLTLTLEESMHVGYGKVCAGHEGWWYPTKKELTALTAGKVDDLVEEVELA